MNERKLMRLIVYCSFVALSLLCAVGNFILIGLAYEGQDLKFYGVALIILGALCVCAVIFELLSNYLRKYRLAVFFTLYGLIAAYILIDILFYTMTMIDEVAIVGGISFIFLFIFQIIAGNLRVDSAGGPVAGRAVQSEQEQEILREIEGLKHEVRLTALKKEVEALKDELRKS